jgi:hypothetical protein
VGAVLRGDGDASPFLSEAIGHFLRIVRER